MSPPQARPGQRAPVATAAGSETNDSSKFSQRLNCNSDNFPGQEVHEGEQIARQFEIAGHLRLVFRRLPGQHPQNSEVRSPNTWMNRLMARSFTGHRQNHPERPRTRHAAERRRSHSAFGWRRGCRSGRPGLRSRDSSCRRCPKDKSPACRARPGSPDRVDCQEAGVLVGAKVDSRHKLSTARLLQ